VVGPWVGLQHPRLHLLYYRQRRGSSSAACFFSGGGGPTAGHARGDASSRRYWYLETAGESVTQTYEQTRADANRHTWMIRAEHRYTRTHTYTEVLNAHFTRRGVCPLVLVRQGGRAGQGEENGRPPGLERPSQAAVL